MTTSLPTFRRKILRSFSVIMFLYGAFGVFLLVSVMSASSTTPKILHVNYDSISAAIQMKAAWNALENPSSHQERTPEQWQEQFESALKFEEGNVTEDGEGAVASRIRKAWDSRRSNATGSLRGDLNSMESNLSALIKINEAGMFRVAQENSQKSHLVLLVSIVYFLITLVLGFLLADGLASRISNPIKAIAETLHGRPQPGKKLNFGDPNSLELLILTSELKRLWERVSDADRVNVHGLIEQKNKLETVLDSVEDGLLVIDPQGKASHLNSMFLKLIGLSESQATGCSWVDLPTLNENYLTLRSVLKNDMNPAQEVELKVDGQMHQFSARMRVIVGAEGVQRGHLFLIHDITEKRQREHFRAEFVDLLSHEIKTPLQSLGTATELLIAQEDSLPATARSLVETIVEDVERIRGVANEFIQVTQSHSKVLKLRLEATSLGQSLLDWVKPFRLIAKDRNVRLVVKQEGSEVIWAKIDRVKFPWVVSNLLSNAIRYSAPESEVEVILTDRNGAVEIQVRDEGPGISEEDQRRMFEPFFQSSEMSSIGAKGLFGIGLTIAKEVVEAHDGRIEYFRRSPQGSEFRIVLPFPENGYN